jgi:hypothetical protein
MPAMCICYCSSCIACAAVVCGAACVQDGAGQPLVDSLFGVKLHTTLKCEETGESYEVCVNSDAHKTNNHTSLSSPIW